MLDTTVPESLALANIMAGLACQPPVCVPLCRCPGCDRTDSAEPGHFWSRAGLKRLGVPAEDRHYFDLHAVLDVKHSQAWNAEALHPLVAENPDVAPAIAEGALMRLEAGAACFDRYRAELWGGMAPQTATVDMTASGRRGFCVR